MVAEETAPAGQRRLRRPWGFVVGLVLGVVATAVVVALDTPLPVSHLDDQWEPGPLVILSGQDQSPGDPRQSLVDQWNALYPGNPASIVELPLEADGQLSQMTAMAQSGAGADVFNLDVVWTAEFAAAGYIRPLDESTVDTRGFMPGPLETCWYDGELWALPFNTDAGLLYYRNDLLPRFQDPRTPRSVAWREILAETRAKAGAVAGYAGQFADYEGLVVNAMEAIWAVGGEVVDPGDGSVLDEPEKTAAGLATLAEGLRESSPQLILPGSPDEHGRMIRHNETSSMESFRDGKVLFMRNWPLAYRNLAGETGGDRPALTFEVAKLPGPSVLGGQNLAVARGSTKPHAAEALIEFMTSPRSQQILFERGGFAATREIVYLDGEVKRRYPYADVLLDAISTARPRPITPHYTRFAEVFRDVVNKALADGGTLPADARERLAAALRGQ